MEYYILFGHRLARRINFSECEWLVEGEWIKDKLLTLRLNDALMDFGSASVFDQDHIMPEIAEELIQNGTTVLQGNIGYGTFYRKPKIIKLSNWKRLNLLK